jgi:hypothetical protein
MAPVPEDLGLRLDSRLPPLPLENGKVEEVLPAYAARLRESGLLPEADIVEAAWQAARASRPGGYGNSLARRLLAARARGDDDEVGVLEDLLAKLVPPTWVYLTDERLVEQLREAAEPPRPEPEAPWRPRERSVATMNALARRLIDDLPGWVETTFGGYVRFVGLADRRFTLVKAGVRRAVGRINLRDGPYIWLARPEPADLAELRARLSRPATLVPRTRHGVEGYRFILDTEEDYALLKEVARRALDTIWGIHAGREGAADALFRAQNVVAIGWIELGDLAALPTEREAFKEAVEQAYPAARPMSRAVSTSVLWRFVHEMEVGDTIVSPSKKGGEVMIGRVSGAYTYAVTRSAAFPHQRAVEWVRVVQRSTLTPAARSEIGALQTLFRITRTAAEFAALRDGIAPPPPAPVAEPEVSRPAASDLPDAAFLIEIDEALDRKGQLILYGPPGTGKTYTARRFAVWWLLRDSPGTDVNTVLTDPAAFAIAEAELAAPTADGGVGRLTNLTFHPSYAYEDFVEGFKPAPSPDGSLRLALEDGIFKRVCRQAAARPGERYLVFIDEINRANIAKVFGEIITLLERDKRGMTIMLPQSKEPFTVPPNVYVLGTMNTADKSIKLLDAALRRRFAFAELLPDPTLLAGVTVRGLALDRFLTELNRRVAHREGREKQIGHSFLLEAGQPVTAPEEVARRFRQEILPLLQEYCYDDYAELAVYIGRALVDADGQRLHEAILDDPEALIDALAAEFGPAPPADEADE